MMLIICSKIPSEAARLVPNRLKFKQLLELCQMICSCGYSDIYKKIPQGKKIQEWIKRNPSWVKTYGLCLNAYCLDNINMSDKTMSDIFQILTSIPDDCNLYMEIETAVFRYSKEYNNKYPTDSELPIDIAIEEYKKYMEWKNY